MIPTYGSSSGLPNGMPTMQDAGIPALDMSSYTVYEWMESEIGLGLTKPLEAKVYAMIYQASMHHRGYFQINQTAFCKQVGVARQTLNRILKGFVESGLVLTLEATVKGHHGAGALETSAVYLAAQGPINAAVVSVMDDKRLRAAREWSTKAVGVPMPEYLAPFSQAQYQVINNPQVAPLSQNVTADVTCGNVTLKNPPSAIVDNSAVAKCDSGTTCGNEVKPLVAPLSQNVTADVTCGNAEKPLDSPLSQKMTAVVAKCDSGTTCGNVESDKCLLEPSTCGSYDKTPVGDFDRSTYIEEGVRRKEDVGMSKGMEKDSLGSEPIRFVGGAASDPTSFRSLTQTEHEQLATFLGHWPKDAGEGDAFEETARAWSRVMDWGFTAEDVLTAADAYLRDFYANHDIRADRGQMRFVMFPKSFLTRPDGLRKWAWLTGGKLQDGKPGKARDARTERTPDGRPSVRRVNGAGSVWAYRDRYGNLVPLGVASASMTEDEAAECAARMEAEAWDGKMRRAQ